MHTIKYAYIIIIHHTKVHKLMITGYKYYTCLLNYSLL